MGKFTLLLFAILVGCIVSFGCATPRYQPPQANRDEVLAEEAQQRATQEHSKKIAYRKLVQEERAHYTRLYDLAYPLRLAAVQLSNSKHVWREFGFHYFTKEYWKNFERYKREVLYEEYNISEERFGLSISYVLKNSPADQADMRVGDRIYTVGGLPFRHGADFSMKLNRALTKSDTVKFGGLRIENGDTARVNFSIVPVTILKCPVNLLYMKNDGVNAFSDGDAIYISKGMMDFVESDTELQLVIAHELAHHVEQHVGKRVKNWLVGSLLGAVVDVTVAHYAKVQTDFTNRGGNIGAFAYSKSFEREADYLGMYLLARGGVPTHGVANFLEKDKRDFRWR